MYPVPGAEFQISRSVRFDREDLIAEGGKTNTAGEIVTDAITAEKLKGVKTFQRVARLKDRGGAYLYGNSVPVKYDGRVPDRIELRLDPTLRTCVPGPIPADWLVRRKPDGYTSSIRTRAANGTNCEPVCCCRCRCFVETSCPPCSADNCNQEIADNAIPASVGEAKLTVSVPSDATVFINERPTMSTGDRRVYVSKGLTSGWAYGYVVRRSRPKRQGLAARPR